MSKHISVLFLAMIAFLCESRQVVAQDPDVYAKLKHSDRDLVFVTSVAFAPDGKTLAAGYSLSDADPVRNKRNAINRDIPTGEVVLWDVAKKSKLTVIKCNGVLRFVAFSPDGKLLAVAHYEETTEADTVKIIDAGTWKDRHQIPMKSSPDSPGWITSMAVSPDSKILAIGTSYPTNKEMNSTKLILWDMEAGKERATLKAGKGLVSSLSFAKDGSLLVSVSEDVVKVWDMKTEKERNSFLVGRGDEAVISPDNSVIAVSTNGSRKYPGLAAVKLYDSVSGKEQIDFHCNSSAKAMLFTPNGEKLITGVGGWIGVKDVKTGKAITSFDGPTINCLAFSAHGNLLASGNQTGTVWLWDISPFVGNKK